MSDDLNAEATDQTSMADIANTIKIPEREESREVEAGSTDNVKDFQEFAKKVQTLEQKLNETSQTTNRLISESQKEMLEKEIKGAAEKINENLDASKLDMAELYLEAQYRKNPDLQKIWDNRAGNPEALKKALGMLQREWAAQNDSTVDPKVRENQRALQESQRAGGTVQESSLGDKLNQLDDADFMREMRKLARSG
ncbi:MAG: hypothetical protein E4G91_09295 [Candidatus Zixiibacteriota bacterium]|nr:MAG: hypothetical protein E4G91_09295 [candidate division Zixibacteria bacterium]